MAFAIFTTWTTYGTWLRGDDRGWYLTGQGVQAADPIRAAANALQMATDAVVLTAEQRVAVESVVVAHCRHRGWILHAVNCRTNHVHVVVSAADVRVEVPREQFKAWCTRTLKAGTPGRERWWTARGWDEYIDDDDALAAVVEYVRDRQ